MNGQTVYLDSSAIVKMVVYEPESPALWAFLARWPERVSSALACVEVQRALRRAGGSAAVLQRGEQVLEGLWIIGIDAGILETASSVEPPSLRAMDAIHLATALSLGKELATFVTYDARLAAAAAAARLSVLAPGSTQRP